MRNIPSSPQTLAVESNGVATVRSDPVQSDPVQSDPVQSDPVQSDPVQSDPVLRAAYDTIIDFGVRRMTLAEVARRAGVSRMTVYRRYEDLPQLLSTVLTLELSQIIEAVEVDVRALPDAQARVSASVAQMTRIVAGHPLLRRVLDVDPDALMPLVVDRFGSSQRLAREHLTAMITEGMASRGGDGSVRDGDPELFALTLVVACQSFVFSARVVEHEDSRAYDELRRLAGAYLTPVDTDLTPVDTDLTPVDTDLTPVDTDLTPSGTDLTPSGC